MGKKGVCEEVSEKGVPSRRRSRIAKAVDTLEAAPEALVKAKARAAKRAKKAEEPSHVVAEFYRRDPAPDVEPHQTAMPNQTGMLR